MGSKSCTLIYVGHRVDTEACLLRPVKAACVVSGASLRSTSKRGTGYTWFARALNRTFDVGAKDSDRLTRPIDVTLPRRFFLR